MVGLNPIPKLDNRTRQQIFCHMQEQLAEKGITVVDNDQEMDGLSALVWLWSHMLYGTVERLNMAPLKQRQELLSVVDTPPAPAWPASGTVVFQVAPGYDRPVRVPRGTRVLARKGEDSIPFRLKEELTVIPANITDVYWMGGVDARYGCADTPRDLRPWQKDTTREIAYRAVFRFSNVFRWENATRMDIAAVLNNREVEEALFADRSLFRWSVRVTEEEGEAAQWLPALVEASGDSGLLLQIEHNLQDADHVEVQLELLSSTCVDMALWTISLTPRAGKLSPDAVISGGRQLDEDTFFPFGAPFQAFSQCAVACDRAFSQPGAELEVTFDIQTEISEAWPPEYREVTDYRWIMRRPLQKPEPVVQEAFARSVHWEYWNGTAYHTISLGTGEFPGFDAPKQEVRLRFHCPADWQPETHAGRTGYFLRLSCGACEALYQLPRRVHTPVISGLQIFCGYTQGFLPDRIMSESYGVRQMLSLPCAGEEPPPLFQEQERNRLLLVGFDTLCEACSIHLHFALQWQPVPEAVQHAMTVALLTPEGELQELECVDETNGLVKSGGLTVDIPEHVPSAVRFGKERFWLALSVRSDTEPVLEELFLNAREVENRVRVEENCSYSSLSRGQFIALQHRNIVKLWVNVRSIVTGEMELWPMYEQSMGGFAGHCYRIDWQQGVITFPPDFAGRSIMTGSRDLIQVVYDYTDGEEAGVPAGAINRMEEEIPFIQSVTNPMELVSGADCESLEEMTRRRRNRLYGGGRVVTGADYERAAVDLCPLVHRARCIPGQPLQLGLLLKNRSDLRAFPSLARHLRLQLLRAGCLGGASRSIVITAVTGVDYVCTLRVKRRRLWEDRVRVLLTALEGFLNPLTGGMTGTGWAIGTLPTSEQIEAFVYHREPRIPLTRMELTLICRGQRYTLLEELPHDPLYVPGEATMGVHWVGRS